MKIHFSSGGRMHKFQPIRAERHIADVQPPSRFYALFVPIFQIAKQRRSAMGHLGAYLMKSPGFKPDIRQGSIRSTHSL